MADATPKKSKKNAQKPEIAASQAIPEPSQPKESAPPEKKMGRPTIYSEDLADNICLKLSLGQSLRSICFEDGMPAQSQVYLWLLKYPDFQEKYIRAREEQAETHADEIVDISDETPQTKEIKDRNGKVIEIALDSAYIAWQKNRIEARKWNAAKQRPKKYGDKVQLSGDAENPLAVTADVTLFDAILDNLEAKRQISNAG
jgi:hypothetical protein